MVLKSRRPAAIGRLTTAVGRTFARVPVSPNTWTLLSLLPAVGGLYALVQGALAVGLGLFAAAAFVDVVDGAVARELDAATPFGAYLDGMTDRFVEAALLFGLMLFGYQDWLVPGWLWLASLLFFGTTMTSFARAYADHQGVVTDPDRLDAMGGLLERAERVLLVFVSMVAWFVEPALATSVIAFATVLAAITLVQRMAHVRKAAT